MARGVAAGIAALLSLSTVGIVSGCGALGSGGCNAGVSAGVLPDTKHVGRVVDVRDYCGDPGASKWRGWVIAPSAGTTAAQAQARLVMELRVAGWRPMSNVPPVAPGFQSLCRPGWYATVFTADQASRAEAAQQFIDEAPLDGGQLQVVVGKNDSCAT